MVGTYVLTESSEPGGTDDISSQMHGHCARQWRVEEVIEVQGVEYPIQDPSISDYLLLPTYQRSWSTRVLVSSRSSNNALRYKLGSGPSMPYVLS